MGEAGSDGPGGPLRGVRVVEAGSFAGVPSGAAVLADWGAEVIKLEPPWGDRARAIAKNRPGMTMSPRFELHNRNKRSVAVDLRAPQGQEVLDRLLHHSDVVMTNIRPAKLERLGLDAASIRARNPRAIHASLTAYGLGHEYQDRASTDHGAFWSASGFARTVGPEEGEPLQPAGGVGDRSAGLALAGAICAALFRRERDGRGCRVSVSLLATGTWMLGSDYSDVLRGGKRYGHFDHRTAPIPTLNCYETKDGEWLWLQVIDPERHWRRLAGAVGLDALTEDADLHHPTNEYLGSNAGRVIDLLQQAFHQRTRDEWEVILDQHDVAHAPVMTIEELVASDLGSQAQLASVAGPRPGTDGEPTPMLRSPVTFDDRNPELVLAPELGADTDAVLADLDLDGAAIDALRANGTVA